MEYETTVKHIGGSCYLRLPPKLVKNYKLKDGSEMRLREADRMIVADTNTTKIDKAGRELLDMMKKGLNLDYKITREEIYETDRY